MNYRCLYESLWNYLATMLKNDTVPSPYIVKQKNYSQALR